MEISRRKALAGLGVASLPARVMAAGAAFHALVRLVGGTHSSLAEALAAAPAGTSEYRISLGAGRWNEKLVVTRPNILIQGEDRRDTVLTAATASGHARPGGGTWGTFGSATLTVDADNVTLRNLTVENDFDYVANLRSRTIGNAQAVALALGDRADRTVIERVDLLGHQDTFYLRRGRALVRDCLITGNVDFVFGGAAALFQYCELRSRLRPGEPLQGYVAAPSTARDQPHGLVFDRCRLSREQGVHDASVWLGRPWRAGGNPALLGAAAYLDCWMDAHIHPEGWTWMGYKGPGDYPMRLEAGDARFFEHGSRGPGARQHRARRQLSRREATQHRSLLSGWAAS